MGILREDRILICDDTVPGSGEPAPGDGDAAPVVDGDVNSEVGAEAPAVPVSGGATVDSGAVADDVADLGVCVNAGVNQEPDTCEQSASGAPDGGGNQPGDGTPMVDGDVDSGTRVDAPVPVDSEATVDGGVVADELADVGVCLGAGVNQDPASCEDPPPPHPVISPAVETDSPEMEVLPLLLTATWTVVLRWTPPFPRAD